MVEIRSSIVHSQSHRTLHLSSWGQLWCDKKGWIPLREPFDKKKGNIKLRNYIFSGYKAWHKDVTSIDTKKAKKLATVIDFQTTIYSYKFPSNIWLKTATPIQSHFCTPIFHLQPPTIILGPHWNRYISTPSSRMNNYMYILYNMKWF